MKEQKEIMNRECEMYHFHAKELEAQAQASSKVVLTIKTKED